jgi:hypothetical protein
LIPIGTVYHGHQSGEKTLYLGTLRQRTDLIKVAFGTFRISGECLADTRLHFGRLDCGAAYPRAAPQFLSADCDEGVGNGLADSGGYAGKAALHLVNELWLQRAPFGNDGNEGANKQRLLRAPHCDRQVDRTLISEAAVRQRSQYQP